VTSQSIVYLSAFQLLISEDGSKLKCATINEVTYL